MHKNVINVIFFFFLFHGHLLSGFSKETSFLHFSQCKIQTSWVFMGGLGNFNVCPSEENVCDATAGNARRNKIAANRSRIENNF